MGTGGIRGDRVTRVLVCAVHSANVLGEVVDAHPGLELAGCVPDPEGLERALIRTSADSIILGAEVRDPVGRCRRLLERFPDVRILVLCNAERSGVLLRAGEPALELGDLSLEKLLDSVSSHAVARLQGGAPGGTTEEQVSG
jgi:hypothetical protein